MPDNFSFANYCTSMIHADSDYQLYFELGAEAMIAFLKESIDSNRFNLLYSRMDPNDLDYLLCVFMREFRRSILP